MERKNLEVEYRKEKAKLYIELMKVSTAFIIATTGGLVGLFFKLDRKISLPLIAIGLWVLAVSFITFAKAWLAAKENVEEIKRWIEKS